MNVNAKSSNKILANQNWQYIKIIPQGQMDSIPAYKIIKFKKIIKVLYLIN